MFRELLGGLMRRKEETSRPPMREDGLNDDRARLAASLSTPARTGQGLDRGSWVATPESAPRDRISVPKVAPQIQETAPQSPEATRSGQPTDPFNVEPLPQGAGFWEASRNKKEDAA